MTTRAQLEALVADSDQNETLPTTATVVACDRCEGTGRSLIDPGRGCSFCRGAGKRFYAPCERCGGRGHGPSAPTGQGWWYDETELEIWRRMEAARAPDSWDAPGWDESDQVECPICRGTGLVQISDPFASATVDEEVAF